MDIWSQISQKAGDLYPVDQSHINFPPWNSGDSPKIFKHTLSRFFTFHNVFWRVVNIKAFCVLFFVGVLVRMGNRASDIYLLNPWLLQHFLFGFQRCEICYVHGQVWWFVLFCFPFKLFVSDFWYSGIGCLVYATNSGTLSVLFPQICLQTPSFLFLGF